MSDITWADKATGGTFTAADANEVKTAVNSKQDTVASGTQALGTTEIADSACATVITIAAPGVLTTDVVDIGYNSTPVGKTGYDPTAAELTIRAFPGTDEVNILVCNNTGAAVTPDAMTINYKVTR